MAKSARERRVERRAADREEQARLARENVTHGCIECGRGEVNTSLLPPPLDKVNAKLHIVPCDDVQAHTPPAGRHIGRCGGWVYRHENPRICQAVKAQGRAAIAATAGAN